ncbi:hypothetical protein BDF22DRAFT_7467 [Syncephalis plumigaleata]|nr:hypothetical protein BDF22DRAFT_7467 [Syncephalis plumigaleata]
MSLAIDISIRLKHLTLEISANLHRSPSSYPTNMGAIEDTTASTLHTPFTHHPSNPNGNPGGNKNTIDLLEMFRQASLNATPTTTTAASAASATTAANIASSPLSVPAALISSGSTSSPIDELLRTRSRLMPMGQSPLTATTTAGIDQSSQLSLPPPPAPIPTAFEHYAPEEQRGNTASLLALLMGGNGATPTTSGPPPPPPHYHHPTPSPHQIPTQLPQSLAPPVLNQDTNLSSSLALPPPSLSSSASNQVPSFEQPHPHPHQPPLPPPSSSSSSVYTGALPNHNPPNNPPRSDTSTTDHALARLFARFAPSQSQPLFVQTVLHAINVR